MKDALINEIIERILDEDFEEVDALIAELKRKNKS